MELLDGVLIDLLKTKWNTFVKSRFYQQFHLFSVYFMFSLVSYTLRPGPPIEDDDDEEGAKGNSTEDASGSITALRRNTSATRLSEKYEEKKAQLGRDYGGFWNVFS